MLLSRSRLSNQWARKRYIILVTSTILQLQQVVVASSSSTASTCRTKMGAASYPLLQKWQQSHDSWLLRFGLPSDQKFLGTNPMLPTCISVHHDSTLLDQDNNQVGLLKKSYSPISHPATESTFDLLVKAYTPVPGGGVGDAICNLQVGQSLVGKLKPERLVHGSPLIGKRWDRIGLIAGGTGVAPLIQLARIILDDPTDTTKVHVSSLK
jgi:cytochrome-b5 reductase